MERTVAAPSLTSPVECQDMMDDSNWCRCQDSAVRCAPRTSLELQSQPRHLESSLAAPLQMPGLMACCMQAVCEQLPNTTPGER